MKAGDFFRKFGLATLGLAIVTRRNIEAIAKRLVVEGKMNKKEAVAWKKKMSKLAAQSSKQMAMKVSKAMQSTLKRSGVATRKEVNELKRRLEQLEKNR